MTTVDSKITSIHSDKMGELLKWCQKLDKVNHEDVLKHIHFILELLTIHQLKAVLFSGLLQCADDIEYGQIFKMKNNLPSYDISNVENGKEMVLEKVHPMKQLLDMIPTDIILNKVCPCLRMKDIFNFSACARRYAIICHSPPAMNNFQLMIKGNEICSEENYFHKHRTDHHRLLEVKHLTIGAQHFNDHVDIPHYLIYFFCQLKHVQHLTYKIRRSKWNIGRFAKPCFKELKSISFIDSHVRMEDFLWLLENNQRIEMKEKENINANNTQKIFFNSETIYNLERIAFNDCTFYNNSLPYLCELLLPSKNNKLSVLKLQFLNLNFKYNEEKYYFENLLKDQYRIRGSLCNLKAFVANVFNSRWNFGNILSRTILCALQFQLECIHIHFNGNSIEDYPYQYLMQDKKYYQDWKQDEILHLKELCISFPELAETNDEILKKISQNLLENVFLTHLPNKNTGGLEKLCLVFPSFAIANEFVENPLKCILRKSTSLKFLQLKIDGQCSTKDPWQFFECLRYLFQSIVMDDSVLIFSDGYLQKRKEFTEREFVLKVQLKYSHIFSRVLKNLIDMFLFAFPNGVFHFNCSNMVMAIFANGILKDKTKFCAENKNSFSVMNLKAYGKYISYDTKWMCDCKKCNVNNHGKNIEFKITDS